MSKLNIGWHVLYVKTKHEKKIDLLLKDLGIESFLPCVKQIVQWSDRKKKVQKPLFPSYIFINIKSKSEFHKPLKIDGVFKYLRCGEHFAKVRTQELYKIKQFLQLEGISEVVATGKIPCKGERMTINYGQLDGLECEVMKVNNKNKILVRIESLKRDITAVVPPSFLTKRSSLNK